MLLTFFLMFTNSPKYLLLFQYLFLVFKVLLTLHNVSEIFLNFSDFILVFLQNFADFLKIIIFFFVLPQNSSHSYIVSTPKTFMVTGVVTSNPLWRIFQEGFLNFVWQWNDINGVKINDKRHLHASYTA